MAGRREARDLGQHAPDLVQDVLVETRVPGGRELGPDPPSADDPRLDPLPLEDKPAAALRRLPEPPLRIGISQRELSQRLAGVPDGGEGDVIERHTRRLRAGQRDDEGPPIKRVPERERHARAQPSRRPSTGQSPSRASTSV
jgi:hypothetical protein